MKNALRKTDFSFEEKLHPVSNLPTIGNILGIGACPHEVESVHVCEFPFLTSTVRLDFRSVPALRVVAHKGISAISCPDEGLHGFRSMLGKLVDNSVVAGMGEHVTKFLLQELKVQVKRPKRHRRRQTYSR